MRQLRFTWKYGLCLMGLVGMLTTIPILSQESSPGCGTHVFGRWSLPLFVFAFSMGTIGAGTILVALFAKEQAARALCQRLLLAGLSVGFSLAALDIALRLTEPPYSWDRPYYASHEVLGYWHEPRRRYEEISPEGEFHTVYFSDENGLFIRRGSNKPDPDAVRILFLGDSFMIGADVPPDQVLSERVVDRLEAATADDYQAFNLGVPGYSPLQYLLAYKLYAPDLDPQLVVVEAYVGNDFTETARMVLDHRVVYDDEGQPVAIRPAIDYERGTGWSNAALLQPYEEARSRVVPPETWQNGVASVARMLVITPMCHSLDLAQFEPRTYEPQSLSLEPIDDGALLDCKDTSGDLTQVCGNYAIRNESLIRNNYDAVFKDQYTESDLVDIESTFDALRRLAAEVNTDGRDLLVIILPVNNQVPRQGEGVKPHRGLAPGEFITSTAPQELVRDFCETEGLDCIDMLPVFLARGNEQLYYVYNVHLAPPGHDLVAQTVVEHLLDVP